MQSQMHAFVEKVSVLRSESLRVGLLASLRAAKTIEKTEFADFIESPDTALWKLAVVSMLVNDGLIVFSTTEGDSDAEHIQSDISVQRLEQLRASCGEQEQEDASSEFERQLEQLGMEGQGCGFGKYTITQWRSLCVRHAGITRDTTTRTRAACATLATLPGTATRARRAVTLHSRTSRATRSAASAGTTLNLCAER